MRKFKTALFEVAHEQDRLLLRRAWGTLLPTLLLLAICAAAGLEIGLSGGAENLPVVVRVLCTLAGLVCLVYLTNLLRRGRTPFIFDKQSGMLLHGDKTLCPLETIARIELREESVFNVTVYEVGFMPAGDVKQKFHALGSLTTTQPLHRDMEYIGQAFVLFSDLPVIDADGQTLSHAI